MNRTALALTFLLALCLVAPLHAAPAAPTPAPLFVTPAATACPATVPAAEGIDFEKIARPQLFCQFCPVQQGETCSYVGQDCGLGSGCSCKTLGSTLACCV